MQISKNIFEIKQDAKKILNQTPVGKWKLGWAPMLVLMLLMYLLMNAMVRLSAQMPLTADYNQIYASMSKFVLQNNNKIMLYNMEGQLAYALVSIGGAFACLDWLRDKHQEPQAMSSLQVFSGRYFVAIIFLWLIGFLLGQIGLLLPSVIGLIAYLFIHYGLKMTYFVFKDLSQIQRLSLGQTVRTLKVSWQLMRGHKWRLFLLDVSFWGWDILNYMTWGLSNLYVAPYKAASYAVFYQDLLQQQGQQFQK